MRPILNSINRMNSSNSPVSPLRHSRLLSGASPFLQISTVTSSKRLGKANNYRNEILYNDPVTNEVKVFKVSEGKSALFSDYLASDPACLTPEAKSALSIPHSTAFLDLDGDCMPDLFLTKERPDGTMFYEIYI
jgi:hypothetical protein